MHLRVPIRWPLTFRFFVRAGLASHLSGGVPVFHVPLIRRAEKCHPATATPESSSSDRDLPRSRPEHENNEPALGVVAKLMDQRR